MHLYLNIDWKAFQKDDVSSSLSDVIKNWQDSAWVTGSLVRLVSQLVWHLLFLWIIYVLLYLMFSTIKKCVVLLKSVYSYLLAALWKTSWECTKVYSNIMLTLKLQNCKIFCSWGKDIVLYCLKKCIYFLNMSTVYRLYCTLHNENWNFLKLDTWIFLLDILLIPTMDFIVCIWIILIKVWLVPIIKSLTTTLTSGFEI
jgi:hypothetical protein